MSKIKIVGRYIGNGDAYVVEDKIFKRFIWTEADVSAETYNELLQGEKDGWFNFYEPVTKLELKQILANLSSGINKEFLLIEKRIEGLGEAEVEALSTRLDNFGTNVYNDLQKMQEEVANLTDVSRIITRVNVEQGVLQLVLYKYQIAEVPSGTEIRMPKCEKDNRYININLIINAKEDKTLVFGDIKWKEKPNIVAGYDYILSFTCVNGIWYGEWTEYKEFEKAWLYKNGDECSALSGGWNYIWVQNWSYGAGTLVNPSEYSKEKYGWAKREEYMEYQGYNYGTNYGYLQYFQTANAIDFSNYTKMYVEYSIEKYTYEDGSEYDYGGTPIHIKVGNTTLMSKGALTPKTVGEFDVSSITDSQKVGFGMMAERGYETKTNKLKIYKIWLE